MAAWALGDGRRRHAGGAGAAGVMERRLLATAMVSPECVAMALCVWHVCHAYAAQNACNLAAPLQRRLGASAGTCPMQGKVGLLSSDSLATAWREGNQLQFD